MKSICLTELRLLDAGNYFIYPLLDKLAVTEAAN